MSQQEKKETPCIVLVLWQALDGSFSTRRKEQRI